MGELEKRPPYRKLHQLITLGIFPPLRNRANPKAPFLHLTAECIDCGLGPTMNSFTRQDTSPLPSRARLWLTPP